MILEYAFGRLNLNKVILGVYSTHETAISMYKKAGFRIEGRIRRQISFKGRYIDRLIMGIGKDEFARTERWTKR